MNILVLCTGNSCRSQMAEAILQKKLGQKGKVYSAGLFPQKVNPNAIAVMQEIGYDISQNTSNHIEEYKNIQFDYILTVCSNADKYCPVFQGNGLKIHIPFDDPADASGTADEILMQFRQVRDKIINTLSEWIDKIQE